MEQRKISNIQKRLFKLYFKNNQNIENSINIKKVIYSTWKYHLKWEEFYDILKEYSPEIDSFSNAEKIELINFNDKNYLIVKVYRWTYLCIDLIEHQTISFEDKLLPFDEKFFIDNFDEVKINKPESFYYSIEFLKEGMPKIIEFINKNKNLFFTNTQFSYKIEEEELITFLKFSILNGDFSLYFGNKYMLDEGNQFYINKNFDIIKTINSNISLNKLKRMCLKLKSIMIPLDIIPDFLLEEIRYNELNNRTNLYNYINLESY